MPSPTRRIESSTFCSPEPPESDAAPEMSLHPAASYVPPAAGNATVEVGAAVSTNQVNDAGEPSTFPAASVERTSNVCDPFPRPVYPRGEVHAEKPPPSSRHSNVPASLDENEKLGAAELEGSSGVDVSDVFGAVASYVTEYDVGVSVFAALSIERTRST